MNLVAHHRRLPALAIALVLALGLGAAPAAADTGRSSDDVTYTAPAFPGLTYTAPATVQPGEDIVLSGTGWSGPAGPSVVAVLLDARASGDPSTVFTTRSVLHPVTGAPVADKRLHAVVVASADGSWTATVPYPTPANAVYGYAPGTPAIDPWVVGGTHQIRFLTGSLLAGDTIRSLTAEVVIAGPTGPGPDDPPTWPSQTVRATDTATGRTATAWISTSVAAGSGGTLRIKGTGWTTAAGTGASTVAVKLSSGPQTQYTRSGAGIVRHPSATADDTIWALLAPSDPDDHPNVFVVQPDGTFEVELDAPVGLVAGQYLTVRLQSGRFDSADVQRSVVSDYVVVGGVPYVPVVDGDTSMCVPTSTRPTVTVPSETVAVGGTLHVTGTGWCQPGEHRGGSVIGVKLDEGAYSRLDTAVHQNRTIWAIIEADDADGTFDVQIPLPDGTTTGAVGSDPALPKGAHTLRLLSGTLAAGDTVRSVLSEQFVVGAYRPSGLPDPVLAADLGSADRGGVMVVRSGAKLRVTVPAADKGDWVFLSAYVADGSPRYPWSETWFRAGAGGVVVAPVDAATLPAGNLRLVAQSGQQGHLGELLGWASLRVAAAATPAATPTPKPSPSASPAPRVPARTTAVQAATTADGPPSTVPPAPAELTDATRGGVTVELDDHVATLTVPHSNPGTWLAVFVHTDGAYDAGWVQVGADLTVTLDLAALADGEYRVSLVAADGTLVGWAPVVLGAPPAPVVEPAPAPAPVEAAAPVPVSAAAVTASAEPALSTADWVLLAVAAFIVAAAVARFAGPRSTTRPGSPS